MEFVTNFWSVNYGLIAVGNKVEGGNIKIKISAKGLGLILGQSISYNDKVFIATSLQSRLTAAAFEEEIRTLYLLADSVSDLTFKLVLLGAYEKFIERKCDIYQLEMCNVI